MKKQPSRFKLLLFGLFGACALYGGYLSTLDESRLPPLKDGDLIFQTTWVGGATMAIGLASNSWYIHTGIIKYTPGGIVVVHAGKTVMETPLSEWIDNGLLRRFAVYRYDGLTEKKAKEVLDAARSYYGKAYDHYFSFDNDTIYCSELEYLAFRKAGVPLGKAETIGTLNINNRFVRKLIEQRWQHYPGCMGKGYDFDRCYSHIMEGQLVTPASVAYDTHVTRIFSNYPW